MKDFEKKSEVKNATPRTPSDNTRLAKLELWRHTIDRAMTDLLCAIDAIDDHDERFEAYDDRIAQLEDRITKLETLVVKQR